jgi:hypothetical protein
VRGWAASQLGQAGPAPTGMAAERMITIDQADRLVLDSYRCATLPARPDWRPDDRPGDDLSTIGADAAPPDSDPTAQWYGEVSETSCPVRTLTRSGGFGVARHRRLCQQRTGTGSTHPEHRCCTS